MAHIISSGESSNGIILKNDSMVVLDGGIANSTTVNSFGYVHISSGGTANSASINELGFVYVSSGGIANNITANYDGYLSVSSGGTANNTIIRFEGWCYVYNSAVANNATVASKGLLGVASGGTATNIIASTGAIIRFDVTPSTYIQGTSGGSAFVINDGIVSNFSINSDCSLRVYSHGLANNITVNPFGSFSILSGGTANNTTVNTNGSFFVSGGGTANSITISPYGNTFVSSGGTVNSTTLNSGGRLVVSSDGIANNTTINSGGRLEVSSGGSATNITWTPCVGQVKIEDGAYATFSDQFFGVYYGLNEHLLSSAMMMEGQTISTGSAYIMANGIMENGSVGNSSGFIYVLSGGNANNIEINYKGKLEVSSGGIANTATVNSGGTLQVFGNGTAYDIVANQGAIDILSRGAVDTVAISSGGYLSVSSLGIVSNAIIYNSGKCYLGGGEANNTIISSGGSLAIYAGGKTNDAKVMSGGSLFVSSGGKANETKMSGGSLVVFSMGAANDTYVENGSVIVSRNGIASNVTMNGGRFWLSSGGTALNPTINKGGYLYVLGGGTATDIEENGGYLSIADGAEVYIKPHVMENVVLDDDDATVHSGTTANSTTVSSNCRLLVYSGGVANNTLVTGYNFVGGLRVYSGGTANNTNIVSSGVMYLEWNGTATHTTVGAGCYFFAFENATATDIIENGGSVGFSSGANVSFAPNVFSGVVASNRGVTVHSGTTGIDTFIYSCSINVFSGGIASNTTVYNSGSMWLSSGGTADKVTLKGGGGLTVFSGGVANSVMVNKGGLSVSSGGTASLAFNPWMGTVVSNAGATVTRLERDKNAYYGGSYDGLISSANALSELTVSSGQCVHIYESGLLENTVVSNGSIKLSSGGTATDLSFYGGEYYINGNADNTTLNTGSCYVSSGGTANNTIAEKAGINVYSGGVVNATTLNQCGLHLDNGGVANDTTVNSGCFFFVLGVASDATIKSSGYIGVYSGAKLTGRINAEEGAIVTFQNETVFDFNLANVSAGSPARINNLSLVSGTPTYTITLADIQDIGQYILAENAIEFYATITVQNSAGTQLGTLNVGETIAIGKTRYGTLNLNNNTLALTITPNNAPTVSNIQASITTPTNRSVVVTADFEDEYELSSSLYRIGNNGKWTNYIDGVTINENTTIYFKAIDEVGNESEIISYSVSNIDKTPPVKPTISADIITPTNTDVIVSAVFSKDSAKKEYSFDNINWLTYTKAINITENKTLYFRGTDAAGNISEVAYYTVANIDKTPPVKPVASADKTFPTNTDVIVSAVFSNDSEKKEYSVDGESWIPYTSSISFTNNGIVYFRAIDDVGNISETTKYEVTNIDRTPPEKPTVFANTTTPATQVTVTAIFSEDTFFGEYSFDQLNWNTYVDGVELIQNNVVYFRGTDAAGNISDVTSITISNIDRTPPEKPTASADITTLTNQDVTVTAFFSNDTVRKEYSLDEKNWETYTAPTVLKKSGTVYFRGWDEAGNTSEVLAFSVTNIDKDAPVIQLTGDNINTLYTSSLTATTEVGLDIYVSTDNTNWTKYAGTITVNQNGVYYFKATDAAGNTGTTNIIFNNIDRTPPEKPTASANLITQTNQDVIVSAEFSTDSEKKEYSFDKMDWAVYAGGVTMSNNGVVYFRGIDSVGNISEITEYIVSNIDRIPPQKPSASADITTTTHGKVNVTAIFSEDSAVKEYSYDGLNWTVYTGAIQFAQNGSVFFRGTDLAGNSSELERYDVLNIEIVIPKTPVASAEYNSEWNQVVVSATFGDDSVKNEYSMDGINWITYESPISFFENGTVYFRSTNEYGHVSDVATYIISSLGTPTSSGLVIYNADSRIVSAGQFYVKTTVNYRGKLIISSGGIAVDTKVNSGGTLHVSSGGAAIGVSTITGIVDVWGYLEKAYLSGGIANPLVTIYQGGILSSATVTNGVDLHVFGSAYDIVLDQGKQNGDLSDLYLSNGGYAKNISVRSGGYFVINSGATGVSAMICSGGSLYVRSGGTASIVFNPWQGSIYSSAGASITYLEREASIYYGNGNRGTISKYDVMDSMSVESGNSVIIFSNGIAKNIAVNSGGYLYVSSGGKASVVFNPWQGSVYSSAGANVTYLEREANIYYGNRNQGTISKYDVMESMTVESGNSLIIYSNGTANNIAINSGGYLYVSSGGTVTNISWTPGTGHVDIAEGAYVTYVSQHTGVYYGYANQLLSQSMVMDGKNVTSGYSMYVMKDGTTNSTTVNYAGKLFVSSGGTTNNTTVNSGAIISFTKGGIGNSTTINYGCSINVSNGVLMNSTTVNSNGQFNISSGGTANNIVVNQSGILRVSSGGTAAHIVASSGTILDFAVAPDTYIEGENTNSAFEIKNGIAALYSVNSNNILRISSGGQTRRAYVYNGGSIIVSTGGVANSSFLSGGSMTVEKDGIATIVAVKTGGALGIAKDGVADNIDVSSGGRMNVSTKGAANSISILGSGSMTVASGGSASNITASYGTYLGLAVASNTYIQGTSNGNAFEIKDAYLLGYSFNSGYLTVYSGGVARDIVCQSGNMNVLSSGFVAFATLNQSGRLYVSSGGLVNNINVNNYYSYLYVSSGGVANDTFINSGCFTVSYGGYASAVTLRGQSNRYNGDIYNSGIIDDVTVETYGDYYVLNGGIANHTILKNAGYMYVSSGCKANDTVICQGGSMWINYGSALDIRIESGGYLSFEHSKITGKITIANGGTLHAGPGAVIDFDISHLAPGIEGPRVNNLSLIEADAPAFTLTVSDLQWNGSYILAKGVTEFDNLISVKSLDNETVHMVAVDETANVDGVEYTLLLVDNTLSVTVTGGQDIPEIPISIDINGDIDQVATITANFSEKAVMREYSFDNETWYVYTEPLQFEENETVYFLGKEQRGFVCEIASYTISAFRDPTSSGLVLNNGVSTGISSGVIFADTTVNSGGTLNIYSGGIANATTINSFGRASVSNGGLANRTYVNSNGQINVFRGGVVKSAIINANGSMFVSSGGSAIKVTENGGYVDVQDGAEATFIPNTFSKHVLSNASATIHSGTLAEYTTVSNNGRLSVFSGGTASFTTVNSCGWNNGLFVFSGGSVNSTTVNSNGSLSLLSGGKANNTTVNSNGRFLVSNDGIANNTTVYGQITISSGGYASDVIVLTQNNRNEGDIYVYNEGVVEDVRVEQYGDIYINSGGTANRLNVCSTGRIVINSGGTITDVIVSSGAILDFAVVSDTLIQGVYNGISFEMKDAALSGYSVDSGNRLYVSSNGLANNIMVNSGGFLFVSSGGKAIEIKENGGYVDEQTGAEVTYARNTFKDQVISNASATVHSGTTASKTTILSGRLTVFSGGRADHTIVNSCGWDQGLHVLSGGTAENTTIESGGSLSVSSGAIAIGTTVNSEGKLYVSSCGVANNTTISSSGELFIFGGGGINSATIYSGGRLCVSSGGSADNLTISNGATIEFTVAPDTLLRGIYGGKVFEIKDSLVSDYTIVSGCVLNISSGGTANQTIVNTDGILYVSSKGYVSNTNINSGGSLIVDFNGIANDTQINAGGNLIVYSGGTATNILWTPCVGSVTIVDGAQISFANDFTGVYYGSNNTLISHSIEMNGQNVASEAIMYVMSNGLANNATLGGGNIYVSKGGIANNTVVSEGYLYVSNGAAADSTTLYGGGLFISGGRADNTKMNAGTIYINSDGIASSILLNGGNLVVSNGGTADNVTINKGSISISSGGIANNTTINSGNVVVARLGTANDIIMSGGSVRVAENGIVNNIILSGGTLLISNGGKVNSAVVNSNCTLNVSSGGIVNSTTINEGGYCKLEGRYSWGGSANETIINSDGRLDVSSGCFAKNVTVNEGGVLFISSGTAVSIVENGGYVEVVRGNASYKSNVFSGINLTNQSATVHSGTTANSITIKSSGKLIVYAGGITDDITVESGGTLTISSGATATNILWTPFAGTVSIAEGAYVTFVNQGSGVYFGSNDQLLSHAQAINSQAISNASMYVYSGGTANSTTLDSGRLIVSLGGTANIVAVNEYGSLSIADSGTANSITLNENAKMYVSSGGSANNTKVNVNAGLFVSKGATATAIVEDGGFVDIQSGANASFVANAFNGLIVSNNTVTVHSGTTANVTTIESNGQLLVYSGGSADKTIINSCGWDKGLYVYSGGKADSTTINANASMYISSGGTANNTTVNINGSMFVFSGAIATAIVENGGFVNVQDGANVTFVSNTFNDLILSNTSATVHSGTTANAAIINSNGQLLVYQGGVASRTTIDSCGWSKGLYVYNEGKVDSTTINANASMYISSGGTANNTMVNASGNLLVSSGGEVTTTTLNGNASMWVFSAGLANRTIVNPQGKLFVSSGATATEVVENGGYLDMQTGANVTFVSNTFKDLILSNTSATVHSGTNANTTIVDTNGQLLVFDGGTANTATINESGSIIVSSGGIALSITVNEKGKLTISSGGEAKQIVENGGYIDIADGADASFTSNTIRNLVLSNTSATLHSGTTANTIFIDQYGSLLIFKGGKTDHAVINSAGSIVVSNGGIAIETTINSNGRLALSSGGLANNNTVAGGIFEISQGGSADNTIVEEKGSMVVSSEGKANNVIVNSLGYFTVSTGGIVDNITVSAGGILSVSSGGTATNIHWTPGEGALLIAEDSYVTFASNYSGVYYGSDNQLLSQARVIESQIISNASVFVMSGGTALNTEIISGGALTVFSGGTASCNSILEGNFSVSNGGNAKDTIVNYLGSLSILKGGTIDDVTVNSGGNIFVASGGSAVGVMASNGAHLELTIAPNTFIQGTSDGNTFEIKDSVLSNYTIQNGRLNIQSGGTGNNIVVSGGSLTIQSKGNANGVVISGGRFHVSSGGTATDVDWTPFVGSVTIANGAYVTFANPLSGIYYGSGNQLLSHTMVMASQALIKRTSMYVMSGGIAIGTMVGYDWDYYDLPNIIDGVDIETAIELWSNNNSSSSYYSNPDPGELYVCSGGTAILTMVNHSRGRLYISSGGTAIGTTVMSGQMTVSCGGVASAVELNYSANVDVLSGGTVDNTIINDRCRLRISNGALAKNTIVNTSANLEISNNGTANGVIINSGGRISIAAGGKLTGRMIFNQRANINVNDTAIVDFDLTQVSPGSTAIVNNLSRISGAPTYTITINAEEQADGVYLLAAGALGFNQTISVVNTNGSLIGTLSIGGSITILETVYTLNLSDDVLYLNVGDDSTPPVHVYSGLIIDSGTNIVAQSGDLFYETQILSGGELRIVSGGLADGIVVSPDGSLHVASGGTATDIVWTPCEGRVFIDDGATASFVSQYSGVYYGSDYRLLSHALSMDSLILDSTTCAYVMPGGNATNISVGPGGLLHVASGGTATIVDWTPCEGSVLVEDGARAFFASNYSGVYYGSDNKLLSHAHTMESQMVTNADMYVMSDGIATSAIVSSGGHLFVASGGLANSATIENNGELHVNSGAYAIAVTVSSGGKMKLSSGGIVIGTVLFDSILNPTNGIMIGTTISSGGCVLTDGGKMEYNLVCPDGSIIVNGGEVNSTTISFGGKMVVNGGITHEISVESNGNLEVISAGTATDIVASSGAYLGFAIDANTYIAGASGAHVDSSGRYDAGSEFRIQNGIVNNYAIDTGYLTILSGGIANSITVNKGGSLFLSSGGKLAGRLVCGEGGVISAFDGAIIDFDLTKTVPWAVARINDLSTVNGNPNFVITIDEGIQPEGIYRLANGVNGFNRSITVMNLSGVVLGTLSLDGTITIDGTSYSLHLSDNQLSLQVGEKNTISPYTTVGRVISRYNGDRISSGRAYCDTQVLNGSIEVFSGGMVEQTTVSRGIIYVALGGVANHTTAFSGGNLNISFGGIANSTMVSSGGGFSIFNGGKADITKVDSYATLNVYSGGTADSVTVQKDGSLWIRGGATVTNVDVASGAHLEFVISPETYIMGESAGSKFEVKDGVVSNLDIDSGGLFVMQGGEMSNTKLRGKTVLHVNSGGIANNTTVDMGCSMFVSRGAKANGIVENGGYVGIKNGSVSFISNTISCLVLEQDSATVHSLTTLNSVTVGSSAGLFLYGGKMTGQIVIEDGAIVSSYENAILDFDVSNLTSKDSPRINNLSIIRGSLLYTLTVSDTQAKGIYTLAEGASKFNSTISVKDALGNTIGTLANGETLSFGEASYTLNLIDSVLSLAVVAPDRVPPTVFDIVASITTPTNQNVTITASYNDDVELMSALYRIGNDSEWLPYIDGVTVTENTTVFFKAIDMAGNESTISSYAVTNIDKVAPLIVLTGDNKTPRQTSTLTATVDDGSDIFYSLDQVNWVKYDNQIEVTSNGIYYFYATDAVGNLSTAEYVFNNIDTTAPNAPIAIADITTATNTDVLVSATFSDDSVKAEFSLDGVNWKVYTGPIRFAENGTISFRSTDAAGNISSVTTYEVTNIDRVALEKPIATADILVPTNTNVRVSAVFPEDAVSREYSLDNQAWFTYTDAIEFKENGTAYFRNIDAAGNTSETTIYEVTNIDKDAPERPETFADVMTITNEDVTISASFSEDSVFREYSLDNETWVVYSEPIKFTSNGTVWFRCIDDAGNISEVVSHTINYIDKTPPTITLTGNNTTSLHSSTLAASTEEGLDIFFSTDNANWTKYESEIVVKENGTFFFKATDAAGNIGTAKYVFTNIQPVSTSDVAPQTQTWEKVEAATQYIVEYSTDNFEHVIQLVVDSNSLDSFQMPAGNYQMRVKADGSDEWTVATPVDAEEANDEPKLIKSNADGHADVFFVNTVGTWESGYVAQHVGSKEDAWGGTKEFVTLFGKNKLTDIIEGSTTDANVLLMTDDAIGDALFVDDIYSASPDELGLSQSRIAQIDEIRAGSGNDIVDMSSQRFEYIGEGVTIRGGDGNDTIWANRGNNFLFGDAGNDRIIGASGNDVIVGGIGNDRMHGGGGNDIFTFCDNWGTDEVEQLAGGSVTLWFTSEMEGKVAWDDVSKSYMDGVNQVSVKGVTSVELKFGDDGSSQYASLVSAGAFAEFTSQKIFEESNGLLAGQ